MVRLYDSAEKPSVHPSSSLRTNGGAVETVGDFPFMLSPVEAFIGFFSRITILTMTLSLSKGQSSPGFPPFESLRAVSPVERLKACGNDGLVKIF